MHDLIASYLFQNKKCPLPGLGNLSIVTTEAQSDFSNNAINAPVSSIQFSAGDTDAESFSAWFASKTNTDKYEAATKLDSFCGKLKHNAAENAGANLEAIGNFVVDGEGNISFNSVELPKEFMQPVVAERVIRLDAEHSILVGDKETTNIAMTEYLNEETPKKDRWWIWAIVLGAVAVSLILLYAADKNASAEFGNAIKTSFLP